MILSGKEVCDSLSSFSNRQIIFIHWSKVFRIHLKWPNRAHFQSLFLSFTLFFSPLVDISSFILQLFLVTTPSLPFSRFLVLITCPWDVSFVDFHSYRLILEKHPIPCHSLYCQHFHLLLSIAIYPRQKLIEFVRLCDATSLSHLHVCDHVSRLFLT